MNYTTYLQALQIVIKEDSYQAPDYQKDVLPLTILLNNYLKDEWDINEVRKLRTRVRHFILSVIVNKEIKTTYELSAYQCRNIRSFLAPKGELTDGAREFLATTTAGFEDKPVEEAWPDDPASGAGEGFQTLFEVPL